MLGAWRRERHRRWRSDDEGDRPHRVADASRLALSAALVLVAGGVAVAVAALAYGRQAAQQAYDRLLIGAADQIADSVSVRDGELVVDIPASAFELLSLAPGRPGDLRGVRPRRPARHRLRGRGAARPRASPAATSPASRSG